MIKKNTIYFLLFGVTICMSSLASSFEMPSRIFTIKWREEVQQEDGSSIALTVKNTYERRSLLGKPTGENTKYRNTELVYEISPTEQITFKTRMPVAYFGRINDKWYVVLVGASPDGNYPDNEPSKWGSSVSTRSQRVAVYDKDKFIPIDWNKSPASLNKGNLLVSSFHHEFIGWNEKFITLEQKQQFFNKYPNPGGRAITRPETPK